MLRKKIHNALFLIIFLQVFFIFSNSVAFAKLVVDEERNILIVASYDAENKWEMSVISGVKEKISPGAIIKIEYLDSKASSSEIYGDSFLNLLNLKYKEDKIDCILAIDDEAFNLLRKNLFKEDMFFYKKPIVFVGVNNYVALSLEESFYMTGLMEYQDNSLMLETILEQNKKTKDIYILLDTSIYSKTIKENILAFYSLDMPPFNAHFIENCYLSEILNPLREIDENKSAIYLCGTYIGSNNSSLSSEEVINAIKETTNSPIYTKLEHYVEAGAIGGVINDGKKLGRRAVLLMENFLNQFESISITPIYNIFSTSVFNYKVMKEYRINPLKLPKNTVYINKGPLDLLLPHYLVVIVWAIVVTLSMSIVVLIYLYYKNKIKARENRLLLIESEERHKIKTDFIITLSHELRTPLNIILSSGGLLMEKTIIGQFDKKIFYEKLQFIMKNSYRLIRYVNNIIDSSKLEIGYMDIKFENSNIVYLVEEVVLSIVDIAKDKNIEIIFNTEEEEIITAIDEEKIVRVILILLSNSIKFSKEKGDICVEMRREDEEVVIKVTDNGIGINEDMKEKIFDKFKRVQSVSNLNVDHEGSGLGLYIAKGFIELHNGSISVVSEVEKGSTFIITIPIVIIKNDLHNIKHMDEDELNRIIKIELSDL